MTTHPAPRAFAQALLDADLALARAETNLTAVKEVGSIAEVAHAATQQRAAHDALTAARRPLELALILTKTMSDNVALQVAHAIVEGADWPYTREGITAHTGWEPTP